jgi:hypothetical protein
MPQKMFMQIINNEKYYKKISQYNNTKSNNSFVMMNQSNVNMSLSSPMINRIHLAKSGCSACGKKVM